MNIINYAKKQKRYVLNQYNLWKEYRSDYNEYKQWQYNNPKMKTQNAIEAKILRQTHVIEKECRYLIQKKNLVYKKLLNY